MMENLPTHVAIIMDGNGRWAQQRNLPRIEGHKQGRERVREIVRACGEIGIRYLTLYAFSTENWSRPKEEIDFLMQLLSMALDEEFRELKENNIRFRTIGRIQDLPVEVRKKLLRNVEETRHHTGLTVNLALSYSGRTEIIQALQKMSEEVRQGKIDSKAITPDLFANYLYTAGVPDPDLLIRTSGEMRVSNFLLWQIAYTEIYVTDKLWPDFGKGDLIQAIEDYGKRERRFGKTEAVR